jgi:hypothetical protein
MVGIKPCVSPTSLACGWKENKRIYYVNQKYCLGQKATKYCHWETMFIIWTVYELCYLTFYPSHPTDPHAAYF